MMVRKSRRALAAVAAGLALWTAQARAQAQAPPAAPAQPVDPVAPQFHPAPPIPIAPPGPPLWIARFPANAVIPGSPYAPPPSGYVPPPPVPVPPPNHPFLTKCGLGCWSHHDRPACSSLLSELKFVFGSCRTFYGEPCVQGPQPVPSPNGLGFRTNPPLTPAGSAAPNH